MQSQRQRVLSLSPLTQKQADYLYRLGDDAGNTVYRRSTPWWVVYFNTVESEINNPYFDTATSRAYFVQARQRLVVDLDDARTDRQKWKQMTQLGTFPPDPPKNDPYGLPAYFGWWQAENAFRRGFKDAWDRQLREQLNEAFGDAVRRSGGMLSADDARSLGDSGGEALAQFFTALGDAIEAAVASGSAPPFGGSRKKTLDALQRALDDSSPQFSPFFYPVRSVGGGGFMGIGIYGDK
jgi:hypothetical protein